MTESGEVIDIEDRTAAGPRLDLVDFRRVVRHASFAEGTLVEDLRDEGPAFTVEGFHLLRAGS